jgi:hypothetical protein
VAAQDLSVAAKDRGRISPYGGAASTNPGTPMSSQPLRSLVQALRASFALAFAASLLPAQTVPASAPDAATLARYDRNRNGRLDPAEQAALDADRARVAFRADSFDGWRSSLDLNRVLLKNQHATFDL